MEDHLHIRGEHNANRLMYQLWKGSSPHTWRTLSNNSIMFRKLGIISTYVENTHFGGLPVIQTGSSPHTWRTQKHTRLVEHSRRIISTYVENTSSKYCRTTSSEDHLHIRGEHTISPIFQVSFVGSSPHTWRTPDGTPIDYEKERIISTYVENT